MDLHNTSVFELLGLLCQSILKDELKCGVNINSPSSPSPSQDNSTKFCKNFNSYRTIIINDSQQIVNYLRIKSYEILLEKHINNYIQIRQQWNDFSRLNMIYPKIIDHRFLTTTNQSLLNFNDQFGGNLFEELTYYQFEMRIKARSHLEKRKCKLFDGCFDEILKYRSQFEDSTSVEHSILLFLLYLRDSSVKPHIQEPKDYLLCRQYNNQYDLDGLELPVKFSDIIQKDANKQLSMNPYLPNYLQNLFDEPFNVETNRNKSFTNVFSSIMCLQNTDMKKYSDCNLYANEFQRASFEPCFMSGICTGGGKSAGVIPLGNELFPPKLNFIQILNQDTPINKQIVPVTWNRVDGLFNWEHLGNRFIIKENKFTSENHESLLHCLAVHQQLFLNEQQFPTRIVTIKQFLIDLKYLLVGIQSESFEYLPEHVMYKMIDNLTVENCSPSVTNEFVQEFIECGVLYKRLQLLINKDSNDQKLKLYGFIYKTMCTSVDNYLIIYRKFILSFNDRTILGLSSRLAGKMKQIKILAKILRVNPNADNQKLPIGSEFLSYLYKEITFVTQKDIMMLLISILKQCCHVYFRNFQKWLFNGYIQDPCNELFIEFTDHYRQNTKYYFDKAYVIKRQSVPGFLYGFENSTLLCGKYTLLLKAFKPSHPLFTLQPPSLSVCLSFAEIQQLEYDCNEYVRAVESICGRPITVTEVFQKKREKQILFLKLVEDKFKESIEIWKAEKVANALKQQKEKEIARTILQRQISENQERKLQRRREFIEQEREHLRIVEKIENEQLLKEQLQRQKTIEYYAELNAIIDEQRNRTNNNIVQLKTKLHDTKQSSNNELNTQTLSNTHQQSNEHQHQQETLLVSSSVTVSSNSDADSGSAGYQTARDYLDKDNNNQCEIISEDGSLSMLSIDNNILNDEQKNFDENIEHQFIMKKSASDYLNANELAANDEFKRNRLRILSSSLDFPLVVHDDQQTVRINVNSIDQDAANEQHKSDSKSNDDLLLTLYETYDNLPTEMIAKLTDLQKNRLKILNSNNFNAMQSNDHSSVEVIASKEKTDLQINRLKILGTNNFNECDAPICASRVIGEMEESDLEKNRRKILFEEFSIGTDQPSSDKTLLKTKLNLNLNQRDENNDFLSSPSSTSTLSDRQRNKRKVLESEFNIITGLINNFDETPMSTSSDVISSLTDEDQLVTVRHNDVSEKLTLDTKLAIEFQQSNSLPNHFGIPSTANLNEETPISALNTAGLNSQNGFNFVKPTVSITNVIQPINFLSSNVYTRSRSLLDSITNRDESDGFSNGLINMSTEFFTFPKRYDPITTTTTTTDNDTNNNPKTFSRNNELKTLTITTLTNFLQMSFALPMQAHLFALNNEILKMYLEDFDILSHFKSLRNYFFLMDGEFASYICDGLISKLERMKLKPCELLNYHQLHVLLENALGSSIIGNDKNAINLSIIIDNHQSSSSSETQLPDKFDLTSPNVFKLFNLCYKVQWPLNLILNPETISHYGKIFQHLLKLRRISWVLEESYQLLKEIAKQKQNHRILLSPQYRHVQQIRHKLLHFVNSLQNHITSNALQASWKRFKIDLEQTKTMEDLYQKHIKYLKRIEFLCMLNKSSHDYFIKIEDIFVIVLRFYHNLKTRKWRRQTIETQQSSEIFVHPNFEKFLIIESDFNKLIKFIIHAGNKIARRGYQMEIGYFINMLNINGFYDDQQRSP